MTAPRRLNREAPAQADLPLQVAEGVHLRMPDSIYFEVEALGSTDLGGLYWDASSWWAASRYNLNRRQPERISRAPAKDIGSALHALVLEGEDAYLRRFVVEPDASSSHYAKTRSAIIKLLAEKGERVARGDFDMTKLYRLVRRHGLAGKVYDTAYADFEAAKREGRQLITADEDRRLRFAAHQIKTHDAVGPAFRGGLAEVAVFWRREDDPDTLMRAKFDYLRVRRMIDLKSIGNWRGKDTDAAIAQAISEHNYEIQRRLYPEAYDRIADFLASGKVYAWSEDGQGAPVLPEERELLQRIVAAGPPEWFWVFVQLPVDDIGRERGLKVAPRFHKPAGHIWETGAHKIETALASFREFRGRHGMMRPWTVIDDAKELIDTDVRTYRKREIA